MGTRSAAAALALKTYNRISALYRDGLVSKQKFDEVQTQWIAANQQADAAKQMYDIAEIGARKQEKSAALDLAAEAKAGVKQVESLTVDKTLNAPLDAQVDKVILVEGEIAAAGFPVVTLVDLNDQWASFNIREENMPGIELAKFSMPTFRPSETRRSTTRSTTLAREPITPPGEARVWIPATT